MQSHKRKILQSVFVSLLVIILSVPIASADKKGAVDSLLKRYEKRGASFSVLIESDDGRVIYERNAHKALVAASLVKVVVTGAALKSLPVEHSFKTQVFIRGAVGQGVLNGDLIVRGEGDVSISERFYTDPRDVFRRWGIALKGVGIKKINGDIVIDGTYFDDEFLPPDFPKDQLLRSYSAPVSAVSFNENTVSVLVSAGKVGSKASVRLSPIPDVYRIENQTTTTPNREKHLISIEPSGDGIIVKGRCYSKVSSQKFNISVKNPLRYFGKVLRRVLLDEGIEVRGTIRIAEHSLQDLGLLLDEHSINLPTFLGVMNRKSVNLYAEVLLKVLGRVVAGEGSRQKGLSVLKGYLSELNTGADEWNITCGSGLSRRSVISASALVKALKDIDRRLSLRLIMAVAGLDGTLKKRFRKSALKGRLWAKTGHLRNSNGIAGVVSCRKGGKVYFAIIINGAEKFNSQKLHSLQQKIIETFCVE